VVALFSLRAKPHRWLLRTLLLVVETLRHGWFGLLSWLPHWSALLSWWLL
jgi:hypothetical protein